MSFTDADLTEDAFLDGRVRLLQPRRGYRAATDPVFLAASVGAKRGDRVLDVGCGAGAAAACLMARVGGLEVHGLEVQRDYADLARRNLPDGAIWDGDIHAPPPDLKALSFDWVLTNPPFFDTADAPSPETGRDMARREASGVAHWISACLRRVKSGGRIAVVHLTEKLPGILAGLEGAGDITVHPLQARVGRPAKRIVVTARKGAKGPFRMLAPLTIHAGPAHLSDADDYSDAALEILRSAQPMRIEG